MSIFRAHIDTYARSVDGINMSSKCVDIVVQNRHVDVFGLHVHPEEAKGPAARPDLPT
jgi:hypothetical protein